MPKKRKRDAAYLRERLRRDHPAEFKALTDGRFVSVRQAAGAAGLIHLPTRLDALKREWKRANESEQKAFDTWRARFTGTTWPARTIADPSGKLTHDAVKFLLDWIKSRKIRPGRIMKEMGLSNFDYRLAHAMGSAVRLNDDVLKLLEPWMRKSGF